MGFHNGAFATIWEVSDKTENVVKVRMSVSRKDKDTDGYITDFTGYVALFNDARKKLKLIEKGLSNDIKYRIKIIACDVSNKYDKDAGREFVSFSLFDFEPADEASSSAESAKPEKAEKKKSVAGTKKKSALADDDDEDSDLPF